MSISKPERNTALINYLTFIGMIIAYFMNRDLKSEYVTHHIKMMFGMVLILFVSQVAHAYITSILGDILWLISFLLWVTSLVYCTQNKVTNYPFLSKFFQKWFTFLE